MTHVQRVILILAYLLAGISLAVTIFLIVQNVGGAAQVAKATLGLTIPACGFFAVIAGACTLLWGINTSSDFNKRAGIIALIQGVTLICTSAAWYTFSSSFPLLPLVILFAGQIAIFVIVLFARSRRALRTS